MAIDLEKQVRDLNAAYNAHDIEKFLSYYTDDIFFEHVVADGLVAHGKKEFRASIEDGFAAFPDIKCELTSFFAFGNRQCEECIFSGTHKGEYLGIAPTGKSVSFRGVLVRELKEDKTNRISFYYDSASFRRQLGV